MIAKIFTFIQLHIQGVLLAAAMLAILAVLLLLLFLWSVHPDKRMQQQCLSFAAWNYAHRGLFDLARGIPENSVPAFLQAANYHYGIELDVHLTLDGQVVVFHDDDLKRMCGCAGKIEQMTYSALSSYPLLGTPFHIPLLADVLRELEAVNPVPLLVELKLPSKDVSLCPAVYEIMKDYKGSYLIESFNPLGLRWFRKHHPEIVRGQLATVYDSSVRAAKIIKLCSTSLICNILSRPHFISFNYRYTNRLGLWLNEHLFKTPIFVWTIRNNEAYEACRGRYASIIFERIMPPVHVKETD